MKRLPALALLTLLSAPLVAAEDFAYFDLQAAPASQLASYVDTRGEDKLKGVKRVLLTQFRVEFQLRRATSGAGQAATQLQLKGVDSTQLQAISDRAYQDFLKESAKAGIEIIGPDKLAGDADFASLLKLGRTSPVARESQEGASHFFASGGTLIHGIPGNTDQERQEHAGILARSTDSGDQDLLRAESALSKKYGAPCLKVLLALAPSQAPLSGWNGVLQGDGVTMVNGTTPMLAALSMQEASRLVFRNPGQTGGPAPLAGAGPGLRDFSGEGDTAIYLKKPLLMASQISAKKMELSTGVAPKVRSTASAVTKASQVGGILGALGGFVPFGGYLAQAGQVAQLVQIADVGGGPEQREYSIEADKALFEATAQREIALAIGLLLAKTGQAVALPAGAPVSPMPPAPQPSQARLAVGEK